MNQSKAAWLNGVRLEDGVALMKDWLRRDWLLSVQAAADKWWTGEIGKRVERDRLEANRAYGRAV